MIAVRASWSITVAVALCLVVSAGGADGPSAVPLRDDPAHAARAVFEGPDFWWKHTERVDYSMSWMEKFVGALADLFARLLDYLWRLFLKFLESLLGLFTGDWSAGTLLIWVLASLLLLWAVWKLAPHLLGWFQGNRTARSQRDALEYQQLPAATVLFEQATQARRDGRFAEAVRLALLALIAQLQHQGLLRYDPARTNREYRLDLRPEPELANLFADIARPYERIWYGRLPATSAEAERVLNLCWPVITQEGAARA